MKLRSSAPGKLILIGEYAVLFGHPALVVAIDRRTEVTLEAAVGEGWTAAAPGLQDAPVAFDLMRRHGLRWRAADSESAARLVLIEDVVGAMTAGGLIDPTQLRPAELTVDSRRFFELLDGRPTKLGLGSSAAVTVALAHALRHWESGDAPKAQLELGEVLRMHRSFQGGKGSGVDLAASLLGGVQEYRLSDGGTNPVADPRILPVGLHSVFVWTGHSASTASFLARLNSGPVSDDGGVSSCVADLGGLSAAGITSLVKGDVASFLETVSKFAHAMDDLGRSVGMPVFSDEHRALARIAEVAGVSYKPSGAGGGDFGIAFTDDPEAARRFASMSEERGFAPLDLAVEPTGVASEWIPEASEIGPAGSYSD